MSDGLTDLINLIPILRNERVNLELDQVKEQILRLRAQGKSYQIIADTLERNGIAVSTQTIRRYLLRHKE